MYNTICHALRAEGRIVLCVASSGIAALLLEGGRTAHSTFKIPVDSLAEDSRCDIPKESSLAALLRVASLIIWDEITMVHRHAAEALDRTLRDIRDDDRPFGGVEVVFGGDYQQTLPVVLHGTREDIVSATLQHSYLWSNVKVLQLHVNMRLLRNGPDETVFAQWLLDVGHGKLNTDDDLLQLPPSMVLTTAADLIHSVYGDITDERDAADQRRYFFERAILAPRNSEVDSINDDVLARLPGAETIFTSADIAIPSDHADIRDLPTECLRAINPAGFPPAELHIKPGCPIILLRNLASSRGLCNGTRMMVTRISSRVIEAQLIGGEHDGELTFIPRITLNESETHGDSTIAFTLRRRQFPVRLAFSMTINRAQGQSLQFVGLDLRTEVFSHGQLYVALSRARSARNVHALLPLSSDSFKTRNVVYKEVLIDRPF